MSSADDMQADLELAARDAGLGLRADQLRALALHLEMLYEANLSVNLTTVPPEDAPVVHTIDSLLGLAAMERGGAGQWADLGSGGGFPGIPLAIASGRHVELLESVGKKARFLEAVCRRLRLDVTVRALRAEDAAQASPEGFAAVAARAVGSLPELVELASPLLAPHGVLVAWKAGVSDQESERGERAAAIVGLEPAGRVECALPGRDARRTLVVYEKVREPEIALPRRPGLAKRRPLA